MAEALEEIVVAKRQRYEDWRHRHLSTPFLTRVERRILRFVVASALPAAAIAFAASNNFDRRKMQDALKDGGSKLKKKVLGEGHSSSKETAAAAPAAIEAAPVLVAPAHGTTSAAAGSGAAAALKEAEAALRAAEAAQKAALDELQRTSKAQQKKGWF
jgi:hypothetical protein